MKKRSLPGTDKMVLHQNTAIRSLSRLRRQLLSYIPAKQNSCFHGDSLMRNYALGRRRGVRISHPGLKPGLLSLPRSSSSSTTASLGRVGVYSCRVRGCKGHWPFAKAPLTPTARFITTKIVLPRRFPDEQLRFRKRQAFSAFGVEKFTGLF